MKTITVQNETWKMLTQDKLDLGCETIDQVIIKYKQIIQKVRSQEEPNLDPASYSKEDFNPCRELQ